jgi:hypothetical protein
VQVELLIRLHLALNSRIAWRRRANRQGSIKPLQGRWRNPEEDGLCLTLNKAPSFSL